jgi:hypothetical protein
MEKGRKGGKEEERRVRCSLQQRGAPYTAELGNKYGPAEFTILTSLASTLTLAIA